MDSQVNSAFVSHFSKLVTTHAIDDSVYGEVRKILLYCCDQNASVRIVSLRYLNELIASFPSLLCESTVVTVLLELLTVLRRACQAQFLDEVSPMRSIRDEVLMRVCSTRPPTRLSPTGPSSRSSSPTTTRSERRFSQASTTTPEPG
jgi:hypothetical protein